VGDFSGVEIERRRYYSASRTNYQILRRKSGYKGIYKFENHIWNGKSDQND